MDARTTAKEKVDNANLFVQYASLSATKLEPGKTLV
jgi:hypothetical protein